jgi:uncharacterized protein YacL
MAVQSKKHSWYETGINLTIGYIVAMISQQIIFPMYGQRVSLVDNLLIGLIFTSVAIVRSYYLRRLFNLLSHTVFGQSKQHSLYESLVNLAIGYLIGILTQIVVFPWFDITMSLHENITFGVLMSTIFIIRSYLIRRYFNRLTVTGKGFDHAITSSKLSMLLWYYEFKSKLN